MSLMTTSSTMVSANEYSPLFDHDSRKKTQAMAFSANGEYLISGHYEIVQAWQVESGEGMAAMAARHVKCLAVSRDARWIAAGTEEGVSVWSARTYEEAFTLEDDHVVGLDFSPDATRLVSASDEHTATVWGVDTRDRVLIRRHEDPVRAAKYAPEGDRIATATPYSVRVWDSNHGDFLVHIQVRVTPRFNTGLLLSKDHLFVLSDNKIKQFEASNGSPVMEWPAPDANNTSSIALPQHSQFIACCTNRAITFWDTSTHAKLGFIHHTEDVCSIVLSPDNRFLAIGGRSGNITIENLGHIIANPISTKDLIPLSRLHPTFQEPDIRIDDAALDLWTRDQLVNAEALLTTAISTSLDTRHYILACRALVLARLGNPDAAIVDANESIKTRRSVIGYIAKSVALVGQGKKKKAYRACDIAFERFHSTHVSFLLLVKAIIVFMAGERGDAISRVDDLIASIPFNSICYVVQAYMYLVIGKLRVDNGNYVEAIKSYERARDMVRHHTSRALSMISLISGWKFDDLGVTIRQHLCEVLFAAGRTDDAIKSFLDMVKPLDDTTYVSGPITKWISQFSHQCLSLPKSDNDLGSSSPTLLLREWAKATLASVSWNDALVATDSFTVSPFTIYQVICEHLEMDRIMDASGCFRQMVDELVEQANVHTEQEDWIHDFKHRCLRKLETLGDTATSVEKHDLAISQYSAALSLIPAAQQGLLIKRSKAYAAIGLWKESLNDANLAIKCDPLSLWGYERKHAALHGAGEYKSAIDAFEVMLSKISHSPDPEIRERYRQYVNPEETKLTIQKTIQDIIRDSPHVLIHTPSGRLLKKQEQAAAFESSPTFNRLISSMTTHIDQSRIACDVNEYYRYAMLSHRWEIKEPSFEKVVRIVIYDLEESPTHNKLKMFCDIVRDGGFHWAWSDTCCIDKSDHPALQEALVSMFKWYQGSALTIIFLRGVRSPSRRGDLMRSSWNTRAWTLQEYHASRVVRFYNEDWTPYLNLDIHNHKESPLVISEMEEATGVSAQALMKLRPGSYNIREKLRLASTRKTARMEDEAYSLLGIFSLSLPVVYGEEDKSLGRLLAQLLTNSGDTSILAWRGISNRFNSCLPASISVFKEPPTKHIPSAMEQAQIDRASAACRVPPQNLPLLVELYEQLHKLYAPYFTVQRMKLPCIMFKLGRLLPSRNRTERVFHAYTVALGTVEIRTKEDLSRLSSLYIIHPWIEFLLDRQHVDSVTGSGLEQSIDSQFSLINRPLDPSDANSKPRKIPAVRFLTRIGRSLGTWPRDSNTALHSTSSSVSLVDKQMQALLLFARLRQPFGALLFTPTRQNAPEYRRVAADSEIKVEVQKDVPLDVLINGVQTLDVL